MTTAEVIYMEAVVVRFRGSWHWKRSSHSLWLLKCRRWRAEQEVVPSIPPFEDWMGGAIRSDEADVPSSVDLDTLLLVMKPSQRAIQYTKMKAFGNHFKVDDEASSRVQTYDSGVACVFDVPNEDARDVSVNFVGVLKDVLKLHYGPLCNPVIFLRCEWIKRHDNRGNPTYIRDEAGFLVVNFRHTLPSMSEPFIFPAQAIQVFFSDDPQKPGWKVVLQKEPRARREVADTSDVFITTRVETTALTAPTHVPPPAAVPSLDGAVTLSAEEHLLASANY
jgi:hypothetical protein